MKLYSRSQLIKFSAIGMVFAAVAASLITSVSLKKSKSAMPETTAQNTKNQDSESKDKNEFTLLQSENNDEKNGKNAAFTVSATETNSYAFEIRRMELGKFATIQMKFRISTFTRNARQEL